MFARCKIILMCRPAYKVAQNKVLSTGRYIVSPYSTVFGNCTTLQNLGHDMNKVVIKILQGSVVTQTVLGGLSSSC